MGNSLMKKRTLWGKSYSSQRSNFYSKGGAKNAVTAITPINTRITPRRIAYLGLKVYGNKTYLVYQIGELKDDGWKTLFEITSVRNANNALREIRLLYGKGSFIHTYDIVNTFKYYYGFKAK